MQSKEYKKNITKNIKNNSDSALKIIIKKYYKDHKEQLREYNKKIL